MFNSLTPRRANGHVPTLFDDTFFTDLFNPESFFSRPGYRSNFPAVDVYETKDKFEIRADMPGLEEKDVKVELTDGILVIEGNRQQEEEKEDRRVHLCERRSLSFKRSFQLGDGIAAD